jgi:LPXTG-site transpeptidase (sortase) family protein
MEIPGAKEVGWYQYGPTPGDPGSAVLAAHIAYNGRNGVFSKLTAMTVGDLFEVAYDDGSYRTFVVTEVAQYGKTELPFDRIFSKDSDPGVVLITCGGTFNQSLRSYEDNVVVYGSPAPNLP